MKKFKALALPVASILILLSSYRCIGNTVSQNDSSSNGTPLIQPPLSCVDDHSIRQASPKLVGSSSVVSAKPGQVPPAVVVNDIYWSIRDIHPNHPNHHVPQLIWNTEHYTSCACGLIQGSLYCPSNNTIYITKQDIEASYQHGDTALAYIIAHEYAHAMQPFYGLKPVIKISELEADCLAGLYLGKIPHIRFDSSDIAEMSSYAYRTGDYQWNSIHHHGTPQERVDAVQWGIQAAIQSPANEKNFSACFASQ